jgi:hypothetical protein
MFCFGRSRARKWSPTFQQLTQELTKTIRITELLITLEIRANTAMDLVMRVRLF